VANHALRMAQEWTQQQKWDEVYRVCAHYFEEWEDNPEWANLTIAERRELLFLQINALIQVIPLEEVFYADEDAVNPEYQDIIEVLDNTMKEFIGYFAFSLNGHEMLSTPWEQAQSLVGCYNRVSAMCKDKFLSCVDRYIQFPIGTYLSEYVDCFLNYKCGYFYLGNLIAWRFNDMAEFMELSDYMLPDHVEEAFAVCREKNWSRAIETTQAIANATNDFPYYFDENVAYLYMGAIYHAEMACADENAHNKILRMKHLVNLRCDYMNAIWVTQGHRVSLLGSEDQREAYYQAIIEESNEIRMYEPQYTPPAFQREKFSTF